MRNYDNMSLEELSGGLVRGEIEVESLNILKLNQRNAFISALESRPTILMNLKSEQEKKFIELAINTNPDYFMYLKHEQYTNGFAQKYIEKRFKEHKEKDKNSNPQIIAQRSLDGKLVFNFDSVTEDGDEINYFDYELQIPISLKSRFKASFKLVDALALIDKIDTDVTQLGKNTIKNALSDVVLSEYKAYLVKYLSKKKAGYYTLCVSTKELESEIKDSLTIELKDFGVEVRSFMIEKIAIPKEVQYKMEDLAIQIRQKQINIEADEELAKKSLENYEKKLSIEQKYPDSEHSLTEYEKDLALKRYLIKTKNVEQNEIDHAIEIDKKDVKADEELKPKKVVLEIEQKENGFRTAYVLCLIFSLLCSVIVLGTAGTVAGIVMTVCTIVIFTIVGVINRKKFANAQSEIIEENRQNDDMN